MSQPLLSLGLLDVTFISHELLGHIHLELERFSFCPEFHAFYIGEFGQRINRHSDEKGFRCSAFDLVDLTREVGDSRSVLNGQVFQMSAGRDERILGFPVIPDHLFDCILGCVIFRLHLDGNRENMKSIICRPVKYECRRSLAGTDDELADAERADALEAGFDPLSGEHPARTMDKMSAEAKAIFLMGPPLFYSREITYKAVKQALSHALGRPARSQHLDPVIVCNETDFHQDRRHGGMNIDIKVIGTYASVRDG